MKRLPVLALMIVLASCSSMMNSHRMKAAQRKMLDTRKLQQAGKWDEALAMAGRMRSSVSKSIIRAPVQKSAAGTLVDLQPLLIAWESGPLAELQKSLQQKDTNRSAAAFTALRQQCVHCHSVLGRTQVLVSAIP